ncbi:proteasome activator complex subunit 3 isoform X1 [Neodiprion pinetum]|uniref:Proteasome activator complex subunit 3 isoform X1 n=1 Tax=Neodiprion lecontei TaxID=441921 RepID=A0A6J0B4W8_NEOLC|nr:proteasome activator complex subunit 3 isoform X1 [Neodiprion lecontei]XP_046414307.1 proteasome activator complex subunit 3 isoform X1 [Neodiprion fabricii]XP_046467674.1 proteasome activator complex subunit 3 isoform X1 [Neodiprion pinetum]XP_046605469.1 proteasome activator complex subunit 3 isoform X1 [Neodiprion virginianus]
MLPLFFRPVPSNESKGSKDAFTETEVQEYKDSLKTKAEQLIIKGFPEKIMKLNELLETPSFCNRELSDVHQDLNVPIPDPISLNHSDDGPATKKLKLENNLNDIEASGTKVMVLPSGPVPCNKPLCELIRIAKPYIRQLVEDSNLLKMWISFMIPKIEDGNNFGVSIQEDTLAEIQSVESEAAAFFDQISRYFISRGKIVSKVAKYPHIIDYRRSVQELDEKEYLSLWLVMCEVRNRYCSLHDIVIKNLEKIKRPRSTNAESLY